MRRPRRLPRMRVVLWLGVGQAVWHAGPLPAALAGCCLLPAKLQAPPPPFTSTLPHPPPPAPRARWQFFITLAPTPWLDGKVRMHLRAGGQGIGMCRGAAANPARPPHPSAVPGMAHSRMGALSRLVPVLALPAAHHLRARQQRHGRH
jgi:hypothetical protein